MHKHTACITCSQKHLDTKLGKLQVLRAFIFDKSRKERKEIAIEGPKKGRNGIEFFAGLASLILLHYLEHC
ncbi:hypothetical protein NC651_005693 [Populus alba x Populus x berolinensis]|nr:hypothetical protein NC651_005693 [Populus alba x Populus x berolinensis]